MKLIRKITLLSAAAGFALVSGAAMAETEGYLSIWSSSAKVSGKGENKKLTLDVQTANPIPIDGKSGAFGYAALTDGTNNVLVAVTHLPIDDSSHEDPVTGFHTHVLDLKEPTDACAGANFEVDLENSGKNTAFDADYQWKVNGSKISVENVPVKDLGDAGVEAVVSFTLKPILDAQQKPTNLCVTVADKG
jgi:hypothetical protein